MLQNSWIFFNAYFLRLTRFSLLWRQTLHYFTLNNAFIRVISTSQWFALFRRTKFAAYFHFFRKFNLNIISWYLTGRNWSCIRLEKLLTSICRVKNGLVTFSSNYFRSLCTKWYTLNFSHFTWKLMVVLIYSLQVCSLAVYSCLIIDSNGKLLVDAIFHSKKIICFFFA